MMAWSTRLSDEQLRFYFLHQLNPDDPDIVIERRVRVTGALDVARLRAAVVEVAGRHDVLRSYYPEIDGAPQIWLRADIDGVFDDSPIRIDEGPVFRIAIAARGDEHVICLRVHHIALDGASVHRLLAEIFEAYRGEGRWPTAQYREYVAWEAAQPVDRAYWARVLERPPVLDLATGTSRPAQHTRAAATVHAVASPGLVAALRAACKQHRVTPYAIAMAALQITLHRATGAADILVGTPIAARPRREFQAMLGVLVRWVAFRARMRPDATFASVLGEVRAAVPEALSRSAPYEALLAAAGELPRDPSRNPLFQVTLNYATLGALAAPGLALAVEPNAARATPYDLAVRFEEVGDELRLQLTYYTGAIDRAAAARLADALLATMAQGIAAPDTVMASPARRIAIAATFTAEPLAPALAYWLRVLQLRAELAFAPIDQVLQTVVVEPATTPLVLLLRADDWRDPLAAVDELGRRLAARGGDAIVIACPSRDEDPRFTAAVGALRAHVVPWQMIAARYPVTTVFDAEAEAHAPYSEELYVALATSIARALHAVLRPPPKVLVLDCDHTLWRGVVGEDGVAGVVVDDDCRALQRFAAAQREAGVLLALASKNTEADVWDAFDRVPGMVLRRDMLTAWRVGWAPKSEGLRGLAAELGLGLESFVFLDDSPAECAEVRAACPGVTVLQVPERGAAEFLAHVWPLDPRALTDTDRQRAALYAANARREQLRGASADLPAFIASLEVRTTFVAWSASIAPRVAQLTQRTNQFTTTALRTTEAELAARVAAGARLLVAEVSDRFGDYGIVGAALYRSAGDVVEVETLLLSCRALGRGVEQRMIVELGRIAEAAGQAAIELAYRATPRNRPAQLFLDAIATPATPTCYRISVGDALAAGDKHVVSAAADAPASSLPEVAPEVWQRIASELASVPRIVEAIAAARPRPRAAASGEVAPRDALEAQIAAVWADVIGVECVGVTDNYFAIGGDSIRSLAVVSRLRKLGVPARIQDLHQHPTVAHLAEVMRGPSPVALGALNADAALSASSQVDPGASPGGSPAVDVRGARESVAPVARGPYPLSFTQAFVIDTYARENLAPGRTPSGAFHVQDRLAVSDPRGVALDALRRAIEHLVRRTPLLRTRIFHDGARWLQVDADAVVALEPVEAPDAVLERDRQRPFDPTRGESMIRCYVAVRGATELELLVTAHHGFCDGWSLHTFYDRLWALYAAYRDDAAQRIADIDKALGRHEHAYRALVALESPATHAAPADPSQSEPARRETLTASSTTPTGYQPQLSAQLDRATFEHATARAVASQTSLKAVLLEAFDAALAPRGPIATVTSIRSDELPAATEIFGLCWTFAPIACIAGDRRARLAQLHADLLAEADARRPVEAMFAGRPAVASFNYAHFHSAGAPGGGLRVTRGESFHRFHFPLNLNVRRDDDALRVTLSWSERVHDRRFATELLARFTAELAPWG